MKTVFSTFSKAIAAIGSYSQAIKYGNFISVSEQTSSIPKTGSFVGVGIISQTVQVLQKFQSTLEEAGSSLNHVFKTTVFITDIAQFTNVNEAYSRFFTENRFARLCVNVSKLLKDSLVEIEAVVSLPHYELRT